MNATTTAPRREDQPDGSVKIIFAAPIMFHDEAKGHLTLRPPRTGEVWEIGDPRSYIYSDDGLGTPYVDRPRLVQWIKRLIVGHDVDLIGASTDLALGLLIEQAVLDFFLKARMSLKPESAPSQAPE